MIFRITSGRTSAWAAIFLWTLGLAPASLPAQQASLALDSATGVAGSEVNLSLSLGNAATAGAQWTFEYEPSDFSAFEIAAGEASAGKSLFCGPVSPNLRLSPRAAQVTELRGVTLDATVTGLTNASVSWTLNPELGSLITTGPSSARYVAPAAIPSPATVTVTATAAADPALTATARIDLAGSGNVVLRDSTVADFRGGTLTAVTTAAGGDGEVILSPLVSEDFPGAAIPSGWSAGAWNPGGAVTLGNGAARVDGSRLTSDATFGPGRTLEFVATFAGDAFQHAGFVVDFNTGPWAIFSTSGGGGLWARTSAGAQRAEAQIPGSWLDSPHRFRIQWNQSRIDYFVDGTAVASHPIAITAPMRAGASDFTPGRGAVLLDWVGVSPFAGAGTLLSRIFDAGAPARFLTASWNADIPAETTVQVDIRTGEAAAPDDSWSGWTAAANGGDVGASGRYLQYRAALSSADGLATPSFREISILAEPAGAGSAGPPVIDYAPAGDRTTSRTCLVVGTADRNEMGAGVLATAKLKLAPVLPGAPASRTSTIGMRSTLGVSASGDAVSVSGADGSVVILSAAPPAPEPGPETPPEGEPTPPEDGAR